MSTRPCATGQGLGLGQQNLAGIHFHQPLPQGGLGLGLKARPHTRGNIQAYSGEAASYRVLEGWAGMGLGSALLPRSKVTSVESRARPVVDVDGAAITIAYEAAWDGASPIADELESLAGGLASEGGP